METAPATLHEVLSTHKYEKDEDGGVYDYYEEYDTETLAFIELEQSEDQDIEDSAVYNALIANTYICNDDMARGKVYLEWDRYRLVCNVFDWNHKPLYRLIIG